MNRASLLEQTANFYEQAAKRNQSFSALLIGVDNLFVLNRTYGYDVADQVIPASPSACAPIAASATCSRVTRATNSPSC